MARSGFKMKGNPMQRNFGISPLNKTSKEGREIVEQYASGEKEVTVAGDTRTAAELLALANKAEKAGNTKAAEEMRDKAAKKASEKKAAQSYLDTTA